MNAMKIDISTDKDTLYLCDVEKMRTVLLEAVKNAIKKKIPILLMSFTRPAIILIKEFTNINLPLDNVLIVDCSGNKESHEHKYVIEIKEEEDLQKMSITAFEFVDMPAKKKLFIIDAVNVLAQYNKVEDVSKMLRNIIEKDDERKTKMLVFCTDLENKKLISQIEPFFDKKVEDK